MKSELIGKTSTALLRTWKAFYQWHMPRRHPQQIIFIVGCQRSGTNMMLDIFERDWNAKCYRERSALSSNDKEKGIRLDSLELVQNVFSRVRAPLIVAKPLVESQRVHELLRYFSNSYALWMFRDFQDVASSNLKRFGVSNGVRDLRPIASAEPNNWRSESVSLSIREIITSRFSEDMNPYDAAVLFWLARNSLYFDLGLDVNPRVMICFYDDFVLDPEGHIRTVYRRIGQPLPKKAQVGSVRSSSRRKGRNIQLTPEVEELARALQNRLEAAYRKKQH